MNIFRQILAIVLLCMTNSGIAQNLSCSLIDETAERILCHEAMPASTSVRRSNNWLVLESKSHESNRINAVASRTAKWRVQCGETLNTATIILNCKEGKMRIVVSAACKFGAQGDQSEVAYQIGESAKVTTNFTVARRPSVLQLDDHDAAIEFSKSLLGEDALHLKLSPPGSDPFTATFDTDGLEKKIGPLRHRCSW